MLAETELRAFRGEKIVEVKPVWANKGEAIERLLRDFLAPDFILAAGDDRTDEDLFERAPNSAWTVHIGPGPTRASFVVSDLRILRGVLELLATAGAAGRRPEKPVDREPDSPTHDRWRRRLHLL
jgi:trehalose 6-phosphate synthase/phosphatase